jgi:hypothetical protein
MIATKIGLILTAVFAVNCGIVSPAFADALSFDNDHDVFVLPENELTVRYNNKTFAPVRTYRTEKVEPHFLSRPVLAALKISEDFSNMTISQSPETIIIECYDPGAVGPLAFNRINKEFLKDKVVRQVQYNTEKIAKDTGFPESAVKAMKAVMVFEVKPKGGEDPYNLFAFQHGTHLTTFARRMRSGRADVKNDPPVIIVELRAGSTKGSLANVDLNTGTATADGCVTTTVTNKVVVTEVDPSSKGPAAKPFDSTLFGN